MSEQHPINLVRGWPSKSLLPTASIASAAQAVFADPEVAHPGLLYGPDEGYGPLRQSLGGFLSRFYDESIGSERIAISGGASQNMACLLQVYTDPVYTRSIQIVAPAYMLAFRIFQDNGFTNKMHAVPEDESGVDVAYLERNLKKLDEAASGDAEPMYKPHRPYSKYYRHIIYCVPTFSNPSSRTMSLERRIELIKIARRHDALIVADDVYDFLAWPASPSASVHTPITKATIPRILDLDRTLDGGALRPSADGFGNAMSNGSFSKISGPGIRVGWTEASPKFAYGMSQTGSTCSGGAPSQLTSTYVHDLLASGTLERHIFGTLQPAYAQRYWTLVRAVEAELVPLGVTLPQSKREFIGGYFIWLTLPESVDAGEFAERCNDEAGVFVAPGRIFEVPGDDSVRFPHSLRLTFSWVSLEELAEGVRRIRPILESALRGEKPKGKPKAQNTLGQIK